RRQPLLDGPERGERLGSVRRAHLQVRQLRGPGARILDQTYADVPLLADLAAEDTGHLAFDGRTYHLADPTDRETLVGESRAVRPEHQLGTRILDRVVHVLERGRRGERCGDVVGEPCQLVVVRAG